jgi:hypothetical protein
MGQLSLCISVSLGLYEGEFIELAHDNNCPPDWRQKNTILRALNNIHTHARELRCDDPRLTAFFEYIEGFCDILMLHIRGKYAVSWMQLSSLSQRDVAYTVEEHLFHSPIFAGVALVKLSGEGCVQDMRRVFRGAEELKELAQKYARVGVTSSWFLCRC